jgi:hypothetical protein
MADTLYTAIANGDFLSVKRILTEHPDYVNTIYGTKTVLSHALDSYTPDNGPKILNHILYMPTLTIPVIPTPVVPFEVIKDLVQSAKVGIVVELIVVGAKLPTTMEYYSLIIDNAHFEQNDIEIYITLIDHLIENGFDVNTLNAKKQSPLVYVLLRSDRFKSPTQESIFNAILDRLIQAGANLNETKLSLGMTLLHIVIRSSIAVRKLLSYPTVHDQLYAEDSRGYTPFMLACIINNIDVVKEFLKIPGFNPYYETKAGKLIDIVRNQRILDLIHSYSPAPPVYMIKKHAKNLNVKERALQLKSSIQALREPIGILLEITNLSEVPSVFPTVDSILIRPIGLTELPVLPPSLVYLNVSGNPVKLPTLPTGLRSLLCANCRIEELPDLPDTIEYLDARNNNIKDITKLPKYLFQSPIGKTNSPNTILHSTNLLLTGNPLPIGFLNGYGSITQYSKKHVANIYEHEGEHVYTMILPKGTLLFRSSNTLYSEEEILGIYDAEKKKHILYPEFNVFFYPYPFVADSFLDVSYLHVFEIERDVEVLMGVTPSPNTRADRIDSKYMVTCDTISSDINTVVGHKFDPCFSRSFSTRHTSISGMFVLAKEDTDKHILNDMWQRYWSKYRTNFIDDRNAVGVAEIILHPHSNRFDITSPLNYRHVATFDHMSFSYDTAWKEINKLLTNGTWTIDLFTKFYVNYTSASVDVQSRCVFPEEPYKLHYLNYNVWMKGGKRKTRRVKKTARVKSRRK